MIEPGLQFGEVPEVHTKPQRVELLATKGDRETAAVAMDQSTMPLMPPLAMGARVVIEGLEGAIGRHGAQYTGVQLSCQSPGMQHVA